MGDIPLPDGGEASIGAPTSTPSAPSPKDVTRVLSQRSLKAGLALRSKSAASAEPTLNGLPEELLEHVLTHLEEQKDYKSLCQVSKRYRRAATPLLYSVFTHEMYRYPERLHLFLRNIIEQPILATYVQCIDLKDQQSCSLFSNMRTWREWAKTFYKPALTEEEKDLFAKAAREMQLEKVDSSEQISTEEEAQVALLLSRTINLTELRLTLPNLNNNRLLLDILRETTNQGTALQNLRKFTGIYYNFDDGVEGGFELAPISSLFRLPKMEAIHANACLEPEDDAFKGFDCPEGTSTVTEIQFWRSSVCPKAMGLMIGACAALKTFYCDWGGHTVGWSEISFPIIGDAFRKQAHSLERLTLDVRKHYDVWPENEDVLIPPLGSFANFQKLKYLETPATALIGWDEGKVDDYPMLHEILPPVLEKLTINQWAPGIVENLEKLADVCVISFPKLTEVVLNGAPDDVDEAHMQSIFDSKGADVVIRITDGLEYHLDHFN